MTFRKPGQKIGFLGGGQLARMMALRAHELGLEVHILCESAEEPAVQVSSHWHQGHPENISDLEKFLKVVDVATCESEFYRGHLLRQASDTTGISLFPSPEIIQELQDRWTQKNSFLDSDLPTAPFLQINDEGDFERACENFKHKVVFKKRHGGYDGYGTFILRSKKEKAKVHDLLKKNNYNVIAEAFVSFDRELACTFVRDQHKNIFVFPLVETRQTDSRCDWVTGPARHPAWAKMKSQIEKWLHKKNYVGAIAFEFFGVEKKILINESAPRVHNSGHYSQQALEHDQFKLHVCAVAGLALPEENHLLSPAFVMVNLLGQSDQPLQFPVKLKGHLHWYGKEKNRRGRKMGHLNFLGKDSKTLLKMALQERKRIKL